MMDEPGTREAPRARLQRVGMDGLSDAEVLALATGRGQRDPEDTRWAAALLVAHDGLRGLLRAGPGVLATELGEGRALRLVAALELSRRMQTVVLSRAARYTSSRDIARAYGPRWRDAPEECVTAVVLDARHRPVAERVIARGTATACAVGPRQVFSLAVREAGAAVVLVHNHPSGDPTPSPEDLAFTRTVAHAGRLLEVPLVDHVIVAREGTFSFLDAGLLRDEPVGSTVP